MIQADEVHGEREPSRVSTTYILHSLPTRKRSWNYPNIVFTRPKIFCPSYYTMKEWSYNNKKKMTVMHKFSKLVPHINLVANKEVNQTS